MRPGDRVSVLKGVGPGMAEKLARLGIQTLLDLLLHLPRGYEDRTRVVPLGRIDPNTAGLVEGRIVSVAPQYGKRRSLLVTIGDDTGYLKLRFFHYSSAQRARLQAGLWVRAFGNVRFSGSGLEMVHPDYQISEQHPAPVGGGLTPVYAATQGVTQRRLRQLLDHVLDADWVAANPSYADARTLHRPPEGVDPAALEMIRVRLATDELTAHFLIMKRQHQARQALSTTPLPSARQLGRQLLANLGFELTRAQRRVVTEVLNDLARSTPMFRLLQGDVGSGKTVIAAFAAIRAAEHGAQTAIMAPTELLAQQHHERFSTWLSPLGLDVVLLSGSQSPGERRAKLAAIEAGHAHVVVGTHALIQGTVTFHRLALTIIDEQHRFGVHQRMALGDKGWMPHQLVMTATPIPRTLTMALYADMEVSRIDELPPGRQPIRTTVMSNERRDRVIERVASACRAGRQAYWVCTLIESSDQIPAQAAEDLFEELAARLPDLRVGLVHGRLKDVEKSSVMAQFSAGELDLLVATTVIEVGVDVPGASLMVIENPERLGLAQLHQLRGRVGRGPTQSDCILLYHRPIGAATRARLDVMRTSTDGFLIAEKDLEIRGPGELLGTRQTGEQSFRVADLQTDLGLIPDAVARGEALLRSRDPHIGELLAAWAPPGATTLGA